MEVVEVISGVLAGNLLSSLSSASEIEERSKADEMNYVPVLLAKTCLEVLTTNSKCYYWFVDGYS